MSDERDSEEDNLGEIDLSLLEYAANHEGSIEGAPGDGGTQVTVLNQDMLTRRLLWDVSPCDLAREVSTFLGLPPVSKDVEDKEHSEAHLRLQAISLLGPLVAAISNSITQSIVASMIIQAGDVEDSKDSPIYQDAVLKLQGPVYAAVISALAELNDLGMIHTPHIIEIHPEDLEDGEEKLS